MAKIINRTLLFILYLGGMALLWQTMPDPFHGFTRFIWWGLLGLVFCTSVTDVFVSRLYRVFPILASLSGIFFILLTHAWTPFLFRMHLITWAVSLAALFIWLRLRRQKWAQGDWAVVAVVMAFAPPLFASAWLVGTILIHAFYDDIMRRLHIGLDALPLLPFAFLSYLVVSLKYATILLLWHHIG